MPAHRDCCREGQFDASGGFGTTLDRGAVTAELAVALPAVVLVLAACLGGLGLGLAQLRAQDAAADAARLLGRGETIASATAIVSRSASGASLSMTEEGELVCARVEVEHRVLGVPLRVSARSCALDGGR